MPISSLEIANMNGAYMQQGMAVQQNAQMIGALGSPNTGGNPSFGEHVMGRAANIGSAVGGPGMSMMQGLAGLDPLSMAYKGATTGYKAAGMMGGAMGGLAVGGLGAGAGMAVNYAVNQMMTGIQQQQQLTQQLGQSFKFQNQFGGSGFTSGQSRTIGNDLSSMQGWSGPGQTGHMMGFEELTRLAGGMGSMGMGQGVKSAQDFSKRFKEMLGAVKEISHSMQTSLEEAQKMMGDMRGSGVFGAGNATRIAQSIRSTAIAGGVSTSEVTAMMGIGSQMARMTGGLGKQGANAGIRAIGQVGAAVESGVLSEEAIYNTTGLTGAAGKQAFAVRGMQQSDAFLKQNRGRIFMASMVTKGGGLDENAVLDYLSGGMSPEESKARADKNLAKVGRADFIRNEGRTRAAVTERLGTLAPVVAMKGWLESRGIDMNDDRAMLYLQRAQGMGRDEADAMMQTMRGLPQILEHQKQARQQDATSTRLAEIQSRVGPEKWKRGFEEVRNNVQTKLNEVGRDVMASGSDLIDSFVAKLTDSFHTVQYRNISELAKAAKGLGTSGAAARNQLMGKVGLSDGFNKFATAGAAGMGFGGGGLSVSTFNRMDTERYEKAGWKIDPNISSTKELQHRLDSITAMGEGARKGVAAGASEFGKSHSDELLSYASEHGIGKGGGVLGAYKGFLEDRISKGDESARAELKKFKQAGAGDKASMAARGFIAGDIDVSGTMQAPGASTLSSMRAGNQADFAKGMGRAFTGKESSLAGQLGSAAGGALAGAATFGAMGAMAGSFLGPVGMVAGATIGAIGGAAFGALTGLAMGSKQDALNKAVGEYADTEEFQGLGDRALSGDEADRKSAKRENDKALAKLQDPSRTSNADLAEKTARGGLSLASDIQDAMLKEGVGNVAELSDAAKQEIGRKGKAFGAGGWEAASRMGQAAAGAVSGKAQERREQYRDELKSSGKETVSNMLESGFLAKDNETGEITASADTLDVVKQSSSSLKAIDLVTAQAQAAASGDIEGYNKASSDLKTHLEGMSDKDKKNLEDASGGTELGRGLSRDRKDTEKLARGYGGRNVGGGLKEVLSVAGISGIKSEDIALFMEKGPKGVKELLATAETQGGVTSEGGKKALSDAFTAMQKGDIAGSKKALESDDLKRDVTKGNEKKSMDKAERENPIGVATNKLLGQMDKKLEDLKGIKTGVTDTASYTSSMSRRMPDEVIGR